MALFQRPRPSSISRAADLVGWCAYLLVVGGRLPSRDMLRCAATADEGAGGAPFPISARRRSRSRATRATTRRAA